METSTNDEGKGRASAWKRLLDWPSRRSRRRQKRRITDWATRTAGFVTRNNLPGITFRRDGMIVVEADYHVKLVFDPAIKRSAMDVEQSGVWEPDETELMLSRLSDGCVMFDVGANCGWFTLVAARRLPSATIHAFEPVPRTFGLLEKNVKLNELSNVIANNVGVWDEPRVLRFSDLEGPRNSVIDDDRPDGVSVECIRMDDYVRGRGIERLDFIKCDVEGAELQFLRGAEQTLRRFTPTVLLESQENLAARFGSSPRAVVDFMRTLGYRAGVVDEAGNVSPLGEAAGLEATAGRNFLFERG